MPALSQELGEERKDAIGRARTAAESPMFRAMTLEIAAWLEAGKWRHPQDELVRDRGAVLLDDFAGEQLGLRWKKILKKGRALAQLDAKSRHRLRIQAKKVRYAAEFFADLFSSKRASKRREKFVRALERVQDALGDLNDIVVHEERVTAEGLWRRRSSRKRAFAAGLLAGHEEARLEEVMVCAINAHAKLSRVKPFWT